MQAAKDAAAAKEQELAEREAALAPQEAAAKRSSFADGTHEVGVDIEAGKYKTDGGERCYWARMSQPDRDIKQNSIGAGPQTVTVIAGELFESQRCGIWRKVG